MKTLRITPEEYTDNLFIIRTPWRYEHHNSGSTTIVHPQLYLLDGDLHDFFMVNYQTEDSGEHGKLIHRYEFSDETEITIIEKTHKSSVKGMKHALRAETWVELANVFRVSYTVVRSFFENRFPALATDLDERRDERASYTFDKNLSAVRTFYTVGNPTIEEFAKGYWDQPIYIRNKVSHEAIGFIGMSYKNSEVHFQGYGMVSILNARRQYGINGGVICFELVVPKEAYIEIGEDVHLVQYETPYH